MNKAIEIIKQVSEILGHPIYLLDQDYDLILWADEIEHMAFEKDMARGTYIPLVGEREKVYYLYSHEKLPKETYELVRLLMESTVRQSLLKSKTAVLKEILEGAQGTSLFYKGEGAPFDEGAVYTLLVIEAIEEGLNVYRVIQSLFRDRRNYTVLLLEKEIVLLIDKEHTKVQLYAVANEIRDTVNAELYVDICIGVCQERRGPLALRQSYKAAKESIAIGKKFYTGKRIYFYEDMHIERIFWGISKEQRQKIYVELFNNEIYTHLEEELQKTIEVFFENNLQVGETARALYIHRNTLAYRLDKIYKSTLLDLRRFEDAMLYKIGWMLRRSI